jgi:hypothetical protein
MADITRIRVPGVADPYNIKDSRIEFSLSTLTGSIVTFNSQYAGLPLVSHKIALTATQSGSGVPSPQNIRSINGASALNINATNTNLFNGDYLAAMLARQGGTIDTVNKTVTYTGAQASNAGVIVKGLFKANTQYTIFAKLAEDSEVTTTNIRVVYTDSTSTQMNNYTKGSLDCKVTSPNKTIDYIEFAWITGPTKAYYDYFGCIEGALTVDDFIPSNGTYKYINLGGTYYGGEYDARTGLFTVTYGMKTIRDLSWTYVNAIGAERFYSPTIDSIVKVPESTRVLPDLLCESYKIVTYDDYATFSFNNIITLILDGKVVIRDTNYTSVADFVNNMGDVKIVFRLATPMTIQLPPCPIDTLQGVNNIWADTGDTTLQYVSNISPLMYDVVDYVDDSLLDVAYNSSQEMIEFTQLQ